MSVAPTAAIDPIADADVALEHYRTNGWLLTNTLDQAGVVELQQWVDDISSWPDDGGDWLHHRELTDDGPKLCRSENLIPFHDGLRALLTAGTLLATASLLLEEAAVLYKEKINYKLPGGAGYAPHQDAPAYRFIDIHVSCMVAVDDATLGNGCLEVVSGHHQDVLPTDDSGCIRAGIVESMPWAPVEVVAGQTLWFHSRTPHRSGSNESASPRRALYPTYNAFSEGDRRADYYRQKLTEWAAEQNTDEGAGAHGAGAHVKVSLIGDFQGRPVT